MSDTPIYSIGAVAKMLAVPVATLRTWQDRYAVVRPERSPGGHRLYSRAQIEQLRFVVKRVSTGMSPGDAHRLLSESLASSPHVPARPPEGGAILILLAERDVFAAELSEYFLRTEGYEVVIALDVDDAERSMHERAPEVAIIDLLISGGAGLELCRRIHDSASVLAISPLEARDDALEAGASAFLRKPLEPLQLISTVKDLLGRSVYLKDPSLAP